MGLLLRFGDARFLEVGVGRQLASAVHPWVPTVGGVDDLVHIRCILEPK